MQRNPSQTTTGTCMYPPYVIKKLKTVGAVHVDLGAVSPVFPNTTFHRSRIYVSAGNVATRQTVRCAILQLLPRGRRADRKGYRHRAQDQRYRLRSWLRRGLRESQETALGSVGRRWKAEGIGTVHLVELCDEFRSVWVGSFYQGLGVE